ncbi:MAG: DUF892 family protein [Gemmatimonadota bacterium]
MTCYSGTDLLIHQLRNLYSAEIQFQLAMPTIVEGARSDRLARAIEYDRLDSGERLERLEASCAHFGAPPRGERCRGMEGLLKELRNGLLYRATGTADDSALRTDCRMVYQFKHAMYTNLIALCRGSGEGTVARLLEHNLAAEEELIVLLDHIDRHKGYRDSYADFTSGAAYPHLYLVPDDAVEARASRS